MSRDDSPGLSAAAGQTEPAAVTDVSNNLIANQTLTTSTCVADNAVGTDDVASESSVDHASSDGNDLNIADKITDGAELDDKESDKSNSADNDDNHTPTNTDTFYFAFDAKTPNEDVPANRVDLPLSGDSVANRQEDEQTLTAVDSGLGVDSLQKSFDDDEQEHDADDQSQVDVSRVSTSADATPQTSDKVVLRESEESGDIETFYFGGDAMSPSNESQPNSAISSLSTNKSSSTTTHTPHTRNGGLSPPVSPDADVFPDDAAVASSVVTAADKPNSPIRYSSVEIDLPLGGAAGHRRTESTSTTMSERNSGIFAAGNGRPPGAQTLERRRSSITTYRRLTRKFYGSAQIFH